MAFIHREGRQGIKENTEKACIPTYTRLHTHYKQSKIKDHV